MFKRLWGKYSDGLIVVAYYAIIVIIIIVLSPILEWGTEWPGLHD